MAIGGERNTRQIDEAIDLYKKGKISLGKAAVMAGVSHDAMLDILDANSIQPRFGPKTAKEAQAEFEKVKKILK